MKNHETAIRTLVGDINREWKEQGYSEHVDYVSATKNNGVKVEGISIRLEDGEMAPTIWLDAEDIEKMWNTPSKDLAEELYSKYVSAKISLRAMDVMTKDYILEHVRPILVNSRNKQDYEEKEVYYYLFSDLLVSFRVWVQIPNGIWGSYIVTKKIVDVAGIDPRELKKRAIQNISENRFFTPSDEFSRKYNTLWVKPMGEVLKEAGYDDELLNLFLGDLPMWVISNSERNFGASVILSDGNLEEILDTIGAGDLVLIPSSIHEWIAMPMSLADGNVKEFSDMIKSVNGSNLKETEVLSEHPYFLYSDSLLFSKPQLPF